MTIETLPKGFILRHPTWDDIEAIAAVMNACDVAEYGSKDTAIEDVRDYSRAPGFDLSRDAWLVVASNGQVVGYEDARYTPGNQHVYLDGYVHPDYIGHGIGTSLLLRAEQWVYTRTYSSVAPLSMQVTTSGADTAARPLFAAEGYHEIRHFWRMEIEMREQPAAPVWPQNITIRPLIPGQDDRLAYETIEEAFADHWGHEAISFEDWQKTRLQVEGFDPSLCFLVFDGNEAAAELFCKTRLDGSGWIRGIGVRRPWRRQGLGMALLLQAFNEFYRRGIYRVGLGVDAQSLTGATRLYERAGMHVTRQYDTWEKPLSFK